MRVSLNLLVAALILALFGPVSSQAAAVPDDLSAAVADAARPDADRNRDADRKPAESMAFAGVKPGDRVLELLPGRGYFTRLLSKAVGPSGHVYAVTPEVSVKANPKAVDAINALAADPAYANVTVLVQPAAALRAPEPVDVMWTSLNYHDLHDSFMGPVDMAAFNRSVYNALKPGGTYLIIDHEAALGSGVQMTETLHRIDPAAVKTEVLAAGFVLAGESDLLRNPDDPHTSRIFDASIRGKTDQFMLKFRKP